MRTSLAKTQELLKKDEVIIYETAFLHENLFIRADLVVKKEKNIQLIEVKAKSFDSTGDSFTGKNGIKSDWEPYVYDAAFQKYVIQKSHPDFKVTAYLLLSDKSSKASVEGLNQLFFIRREGGRFLVEKPKKIDKVQLGNQILTLQSVDQLCDEIINDDFENDINLYSAHYSAGKKIEMALSPACSKCEFKPDADFIAQGFQSGFNECWASSGLSSEQIDKHLHLYLWDFRKKEQFMLQEQYLMTKLTREDLEPKSKSKKKETYGLSRTDRQWLQVEKTAKGDTSSYLDKAGMAEAISSWTFPLHFIDFETTMVAIPFNAGRRPYEQIAFQFSHHIVNADGSIEHKGQWINTERGVFPNFEFVRALKRELESDEGTIFRYAAHENTILNIIYRQLQDSSEKDKEELCAWIQTITKASGSRAEDWRGDRNMVDLRDLIVKFYFNPATGGSNSIKKVLPAVLQESRFLQEKYSEPIYGSEILSKNFQDKVWITWESDRIVNPYDLLPPIHEEASNATLDEFVTDEEAGISDGGAAMIAYAKMQFTQMSEEEKGAVQAALLRYCELDTMAMVMIYEAFKEWCK